MPKVTPERLDGLREQIDKLKASLDKSDDAFARKAIQEKLSDSQAELEKLERLIEADPSILNGAPEIPAEVVHPEPIDPKLQQQIEVLVRKARVAKMRNQDREALETLREAEQLAPNSPQVLELLGDEFAQRMQWRQAKQTYEKAHHLAPTDPGIERKFATSVLRVSSVATVEAALKTGSIDSLLIQKGDVTANPKYAAIFSLLIPGAGQFVLGEPVAGGVLLGGWLVSVVALAFMKGQIHDMTQMLAGAPSNGSGFLGLIPILLGLAITVTSVAMCFKKSEPSDRPGLH